MVLRKWRQRGLVFCLFLRKDNYAKIIKDDQVCICRCGTSLFLLAVSSAASLCVKRDSATDSATDLAVIRLSLR
ncbi:hypothetical protein PG2006B_0315 [Bifidobacterium animalis subsp. animalis]|nr:hypothetical protein PG2006B_0315 [Bifidobacterium animalis subsp. animalis]